ncbi:hypothetical protein NHH03_20025 [Stieleria sp. TO1_6]|uniref:hypothetical protein n=1 Tax=Stieleria tagensis TaxID=2956795 RepID=UPI00209A66AB|nr:hypothetical protein [Stieleria tagensis]MCO8124043.1 hypothetical protein [Stieleria tagensis]
MNFVSQRCDMTAKGVIAIVVILGWLAPTLHGDEAQSENLFSEITMSETVAASVAGKAIRDDSTLRILGARGLTQLLQSKQIQSDTQSQTVVVAAGDLVTGGIDSDERSLLLSVDAEAGQINLRMPFRQFDSSTGLDGESLMTLFKSIAQLPSIQLSATENALTLHTSIDNQQVTVDQLRTAAKRLVSAAATIAPPKSAVERTTPVAAAKSNTFSILGTWSAKTSATDAWAIRFDSDKQFVMVHTRNGKNSVSKGSYQSRDSKLVISETDGVTLQGSIDWVSAEKFQWTLQDKNGKALTKLTFGKQ